MKIFVLVAYALIVAVVCGANNQVARKFHERMIECAIQLNTSTEFNVDVVKCAMDGKLSDSQGEIKKDGIPGKITEFISNLEKLRQARKSVTKCIEKAFQSGNFKEKIEKSIKCIFPRTSFFNQKC